MLRLAAPSKSLLQRTLDEARTAAPTYAEVGASRAAGLPAGYRVDRYERRLGDGEECFERAAEALRRWQAQIGAGLRIVPAGATVDGGGTVLFVARTFGLWAVLPCRVVYVLEEEARFAFGYGTLPGHLERGEVAMSVAREEGGVVARIVSFSHAVDPLARAAGPLSRRAQTRFTNGYLDALERAAR